MHDKLAVQFEDLEQQANTAALGLWVFLATEILFFGGLFLSYTVYRATYPEAFARAGKELNVVIGTVNTAVLLTSSLFMVLAVEAAKEGKRGRTVLHLTLTELLGLCFLLLKAREYSEDFEKHLMPGTSMLYFIYYAMTGLHALHLTIGLALIAVLIIRARRNEFSADYHSPVEVTGLYWHFVDAVWIFLYPMLYLTDRHS